MITFCGQVFCAQALIGPVYCRANPSALQEFAALVNRLDAYASIAYQLGLNESLIVSLPIHGEKNGRFARGLFRMQAHTVWKFKFMGSDISPGEVEDIKVILR
jgi:hypothetical protein